MSSSEEEEGNSLATDDEFKAKHECTDVTCTGLFIVALLGFVVVMIWAVVTGDTRGLSRGIDVNGQLCGLSGNVSDRPFLYYCPKEFMLNLRILRIDTDYPVCVSACPSGTMNLLTNQTQVTPAVVPDCPAAVSQAYLSTTIAGLYCLPQKYYSASALTEVNAATGDVLDSVHDGIGDVLRCWPVLVLTVIVATILGYIYLWLLRVTAKFLIWICVFVSMAAFVAGGIYLWTHEGDLVPPAVEGASEQDQHVREVARHALEVLAVVLWILAGVILCLACCCGRSVELSTACVQTGTLVIWRMPLMLLSPFVKAITKSFFAVLFLYGFMHLWVTGDVTGLGLHRRYSHTPIQWAVIIFYAYVSYWVLAFITALYQFSIAYAVAKYYETPEDDEGDRDFDSFAVIEGTVVGVVKHTGSLAFGAAVIALLELAQKMLEYAERKNDELGEDANKCVRCMLESCLCCCKCMEGIIQFVNKNAYIDIAVTGDNSFCQAVRNVMHVVIDFGPAMAILNGATYIFQIVGMASITAICGLLAAAVLTGSAFNDQSTSWYISNPAAPIVVCCLLALTVAWAFMAIFDVTTDTLLYCYAEDKNEHNGTAVHAPADMRTMYEKAEKEAADQRAKASGKSKGQQGKKARRYSRE